MAAVEVLGLKELKIQLDKFPDKVKNRVAKRGISKAAAKLRTFIRRAAPKISGELRRSIGVGRAKRYPAAWVGLRRNFFYKRLEFDYEEIHAFFLDAVDAHKSEILQMIIEETKKAMFEEAGKIYAKTLRAK